MYIKQSLIRGFITAPLLIGTFGLFAGTAWWGVLPPIGVGLLWWGWRYRRRELPDSVGTLLAPHVLVLALSLGTWSLLLVFSHWSYAATVMHWAALTAPFYSLTMALVALQLIDAVALPLLFLVNFSTAIVAIVWLKRGQVVAWHRNAWVALACTVAVVAGFSTAWYQHHLRFLDHAAEASAIDLARYVPNRKNNQLATLDVPATLKLTGALPRLDGATAAYPLYAAAAQATMQGKLDVQVTQTSSAYERLSHGDCDVVFAFPPSQAQAKAAAKAGVTFKQTLIAKEAFVFFVAKDNPVHSLTRRQLQAIYQQQVTNWDQVGGHFGRIRAFQRPAGSGSQTAMQTLVMQNKPMATPLRSEVISGMGGIVSAVADYENTPTDLGYSFRYYLQGMQQAKGVRQLKIDGVAPSDENIASGKYPLTISLVAVTTAHPNAQTKALIAWLQGDQGQALVAKTGYVPLR